MPLVNVVRKPDQEELLRSLGAVYVCNSSSPSFSADLVEALTATSATLAFDATGGGTLASQILNGMEQAASATAAEYSRYGSTVHKQVYIYGGLDTGPTTLTRGFGMAWGVGGWLLTPFLQNAGGRSHRQTAGQGGRGTDHDVREHLYPGSVAGGHAPARRVPRLRQAGDRGEVPGDSEPAKFVTASLTSSPGSSCAAHRSDVMRSSTTCSTIASALNGRPFFNQ